MAPARNRAQASSPSEGRAAGASEPNEWLEAGGWRLGHRAPLFGLRHIRHPELHTDVRCVAEVRDVLGDREAPEDVSAARLQAETQLILRLRELVDIRVLDDAAARVALQDDARSFREAETVADDERRNDLRLVRRHFGTARVVDRTAG